jgi:hypothetical protein
MIECKECSEYVDMLFSRGEIPREEVYKVAMDRHILKGCENKANSLKKWLNFAILNQKELKVAYGNYHFPEWNSGYLEALEDMKIKLDSLSIQQE